MKVKVIFTGGTIGSQVKEDGYIAPKGESPFELIKFYQKNRKNNVEFETIEPYRILSENLTANELNRLIACVREVLSEDSIDGIILTHGTDTLQYSGAILSYVFGSTNVPILLVSSDFPLEDERANGYINFLHAVKFIEGRYGKGVFVSYCNKGGEPIIHRGAKLLQHKAFSADVESIHNSWYGRFEQGVFVRKENGDILNKTEDIQEKVMFQPGEKVELSANSKEILRIVPYVGMEYPSIGEEVKVILHESYHSGTINVSNALKEFVNKAQKREIPIYITGLTREEAVYETVEEYKKMGMVPLFDAAPIAQYCKLWLALSNNKNPEYEMSRKFFGE